MRPRNVANRPNLQVSRADLEILMRGLEVNVVWLVKCLVSPGWRLSFPADDMPAIHYNLARRGKWSSAMLQRFP
jgi:AraC family transcriptional activator of mtrCDE